ncbi:hypothetical protein GCM10022245_69760 [Streptomyces mayteni]
MGDSVVAGVAVRIDPGSKATGIAVTVDSLHTHARKGLYALEIEHRGQAIRAALRRRADHRRRRRVANLRYRAPRFLNRRRPRGWLAPSLRHRVDTVLAQVTRLTRLFPITEIHAERVSFDVHALSRGRETLSCVEYRQGTLAGYEVRQYLLEKWGRACVYCGTEGTPLQIEHITPRSKGGSDRMTNLTLACSSCNQAKGAQRLEEFLTNKPALVARLRAQAKAPLRDAAVMNSTRWGIWRQLHTIGVPVAAWSGGRTKYNRLRQGLPKSHTLDAVCVGDIGEAGKIVRYPATALVATATGRGRYRRTDSDRSGFPRKVNPRRKRFFGFATGDLVRAVVPRGRYQGSQTGRVAVRATGRFNIRTSHGLVQGIHHRYVRLLQRADGYGYTIKKEEGVTALAR